MQTLRDLLAERDRAVCIVRYRHDDEGRGWYGGQPRAPNAQALLQVSVLADKVSAGGLIRLGETAGDEILGWQYLDALEVIEVLGVLGEDGKTVTPE